MDLPVDPHYIYLECNFIYRNLKALKVHCQGRLCEKLVEGSLRKNLSMRLMQIAFANGVRSGKSGSEWASFEQPILKGFPSGLYKLWVPHCQ